MATVATEKWLEKLATLKIFLFLFLFLFPVPCFPVTESFRLQVEGGVAQIAFISSSCCQVR
jgi:hypothetical protein